MSFFNTIKKSLGFGDDVDYDLMDDIHEPEEHAAPATENEIRQTDSQPALSPVEVDKARIDSIFEHTVATFSEAMPTFFRDAVNQDILRKKLYDGLDSSIKEYLNSIEALTRKQCESKWASEQSAMRSEMDSLRSKAKEIEQQRFDIKQQQLSADRQKRALNDKVHDLENHIATLEAEREQYDLENKSLINKLKVAGVHESEIEALQQELSDAKAEILKLRNGNAPQEADNETSEELSKLNSKIAELEKENSELHSAIDIAVEKDRIATEMLNGLQSRASLAREEVETKDKEIAELKAKLAEAENVKQEIEELGSQISIAEELIEKRDRKIAKLKETCESLRSENSSLNMTIAANLKRHAETESELQQRISELEADPTTPIPSFELELKTEDSETTLETEAETPKISDCDLAEIEESFDNATWMRTDPPETPSMRTGVSEAEFGYQAPVRSKTPRHDNDAQLSLF